jgi:hypothetical protein
VTVTLASAADARYGKWLLNLLGSVRDRSDIFDRIVAYDLGMTPFQRRLLDGAQGVEVRTVPPFVPHWRQGRTWKTWIWTHVEGDVVVWLDAGITVLRPMTDFLEGVRTRGYFVVSQGVPNAESTPSEFYEWYDLDDTFGERVSIAAGILAFARNSNFYRNVIVPTYRDAVLGRTLGFSAGEVDKLNRGLDKLDELVVRDCPLFRYDQSVLGARFYSATPDPHVSSLDRYGGWQSPHDHPEQVIWSHRRSGDYRFLPRVRYRPMTAAVGIPWGTWEYAVRLQQQYRWLFRPSLYTRRLARTARREG